MMRFLVVLVLLVPLAVADHVYSHRVIVEGRLVGGNGLPLAGVPVHVEGQGESFRDACVDPQRGVTDENGDFWFCFHKHELARDAAVTVWAGNASAQRFLDLDLRKMSFLLLDADALGVAPPGWDDEFRVSGRVWSFSPSDLDGVAVSGVALARERVSVSLGSGGSWSNYPLVTDQFGDFDSSLRVLNGSEFDSLLVDVWASGSTVSSSFNLTFHRVFVDVKLPVEEPVRWVVPGSTSPPVAPALPLIVGAASIAMVIYQRKKG